MHIGVRWKVLEGLATAGRGLGKPLRFANLPAALLGLVSVGLPAASQPASFIALNSYAQPPYVRSDGQTTGLASTLVGLIQAETVLPTPLRLETVPRRRLEFTIESRDFQGVALFLAPEFLSKEAKSGQWSAPVMVDENVLVSLMPTQTTSLDELAGKKLGGIAGHVYRVLGPLIEAGKIRRKDAGDHVSNLKKLCLGRVDFVVMSRSELNGSAELARCGRSFRWSPFPEPQVIVRRVLVRVSDARSSESLLAATAKVACSEAWQAELRRYQLSVVGCAGRNVPAQR